jgi:hypothetical protein
MHYRISFAEIQFLSFSDIQIKSYGEMKILGEVGAGHASVGTN